MKPDQEFQLTDLILIKALQFPYRSAFDTGSEFDRPKNAFD